jgi:hypothetical protein
MGRELTQKIIEAGIVPEQAVKQLKAWRQLPEDTPEEEQQQITQDLVMDFVERIAELIDAEGELPELRETMPGLEARFESKSEECMIVLDLPVQRMCFNTRVLVDGPNFLIFRADKWGDLAANVTGQVALRDGKVHDVCESTPLYEGEKVVFYRCKTQEVPKYAQMRELWRHSTQL